MTIQRFIQVGVKITTWASVLAETMNDGRSELVRIRTSACRPYYLIELRYK
jgi:hypothetical protein